MRKILTTLLIFSSVCSFGQIKESHARIFNFLRFHNTTPDLRWNRTTPLFVNFYGSSIESSFSYWQGAAFTTFSRNGRIKTTNLFDVHGQLRETRSSVSLKKTGVLSYWRLQISPQRTRPLLVYTIH